MKFGRNKDAQNSLGAMYSKGEGVEENFIKALKWFLIAGKNGSEELYVWGTGKQMRDFIHIEDCIKGILKTVDQVNDGQAINLSTGQYTSFIEFASLAANVVGYRPEVFGMSDKPSGVFARGGDTKLQESLGFKHQIDFKTGVEKAIEYYIKN